MAIQHAQPAEVIDVRPLGDRASAAQTSTLIKTQAIEVIRLVLPAGKELAAHKAPGEITLHCLEGRILFRTGATQCELAAGEMLYLLGSQEHSLRATVDSSLLLTMALVPKRD
jgi:quercetin dioxygenase-like cupin family protein